MQGTARACLLRAVKADGRPRAMAPPGQVSYVAGLWIHTSLAGRQSLGRQSATMTIFVIHPSLMGTARSTNCSPPIVVPRPKTPGIKHHSFVPRHDSQTYQGVNSITTDFSSSMCSPRVSIWGGEGSRALLTEQAQRDKQYVFTHVHIPTTVSRGNHVACRFLTQAAAATTPWSSSHLGDDHQEPRVVDSHQAAKGGGGTPHCRIRQSRPTV